MSELESLRYLREVCAACTLAHPGRKADASVLTQQPSHSSPHTAMLSETAWKEEIFLTFALLLILITCTTLTWQSRNQSIDTDTICDFTMQMSGTTFLLWIIYTSHPSADNFILKYNFALCLQVTGKSRKSCALSRMHLSWLPGGKGMWGGT